MRLVGGRIVENQAHEKQVEPANSHTAGASITPLANKGISVPLGGFGPTRVVHKPA